MSRNTSHKASAKEWAEHFSLDRHVAQDVVLSRNGVTSFRISTVFTGIDEEDVGPVLFETMVFANGSSEEIERDRYCTWDEAVKGHEEMVLRIKKKEGLL